MNLKIRTLYVIQNLSGKGKGKKSSKAPSSKGKGKKGGKGKKSSKEPSSKGKGKKGKKSSKAPKCKELGGKGKTSKGGKGKKSSKHPKSKGGKGKKSSKHPKSKGKGGKGKIVCKNSITPSVAPSNLSPTASPTATPTKSPNASPTAYPTASPTVTPTNVCKMTDVERINAIRDIIAPVSSLEDVDSFGTAQNMAYSWLISEDANDLFVCPGDSTFVLQRYILALVYYAAAGDSWDRCNKGADECFTLVNDVRTDFEPYLSKASVCEWFGVFCIGDNIVSSVQLGKSF